MILIIGILNFLIIKKYLIKSSLIIFAKKKKKKNENYEHTIKKELKDGKIDFETFIKQINSQNLSKSDTVLNKGIKLDNKAIKFLQLNSVDKKPQNFYFSRKIDISKNFLSIIISSEEETQINWYLINYNQYFKIIDSVLIFKNIDNVNHISSKISDNKVSTMEIFVDQGQAILQSWETKINENGKFEK